MLGAALCIWCGQLNSKLLYQLWSYHRCYVQLGQYQGGMMDEAHMQAGAVAAIGANRLLLGSCLFCLALNHKHMALYYAPAFFGHLLGKALQLEAPLMKVSDPSKGDKESILALQLRAGVGWSGVGCDGVRLGWVSGGGEGGRSDLPCAIATANAEEQSSISPLGQVKNRKFISYLTLKHIMLRR